MLKENMNNVAFKYPDIILHNSFLLPQEKNISNNK